MDNTAGLEVLITNNTLAGRSGTELYVRDLAVELMKRGHHPIAFSTILGDVAEDLRLATVPVIDDLNVLSHPPDVIHGHHHLDTMTAALHFPQTPVVYTCHGWLPWEESPPIFPSILYYVAVDDLCLERTRTIGAIPDKNMDVIYNFVDLARFKLRPELPSTPKSALVFSNNIRGQLLDAIQCGCNKFGIKKVDVAGRSAGNVLSKPEETLGNYDIVFAKARCALEAMASGCAVVVADSAGLGGLVTTGNVEKLRRLNFGIRTLQNAFITEKNVLRELAEYKADDARQVSLYIRENSSILESVDKWLAIYFKILTEWRKKNRDHTFSANQMSAASAYLRKLAPIIKTRHEAATRALRLERELQTKRETEIRALRFEQELLQIKGSRSWQLIMQYRKLKSWLKKI
ncbi:MAG: glycosyltransferase family 4 protein [Desulfuromonadaceae bacterium]|nr:glycosyltransferase family 4 protein [Desulfuromonadaceae bacterium]